MTFAITDLVREAYEALKANINEEERFGVCRLLEHDKQGICRGRRMVWRYQGEGVEQTLSTSRERPTEDKVGNMETMVASVEEGGCFRT